MGLLGEYIECLSCGNTYKIEILDYDPELHQRKVEALYLRGLRKVMAMMMLVDGKIEHRERSMIRDIYRKLADSELFDRDIDDEVSSCVENPSCLEDYLNEIFPHLNERGRERIIEVAYSVAVADGEVDKDEIKLVMKLAKYFQMSGAHVKGILAEVHESL